jgi:hypothetical protein
MKNYSYLADSAFLKKIDSLKLKEEYIKITALNFSEKPIKSIEGICTGGSVSIDGTSSIRRTCNLNLIASDLKNDLTDINNLFSINKKVDVEIGFLNTTEEYTNYNILWFPLGVYIINNASLNHDASGITISLQLKDKMCLLNGECGGTIPASTTFHEYETIDENGEYIIVRPTIYQIIQELVNHFGGEQLGKIIISDVDSRIKMVMKWNGSSPLYIIQQTSNGVTQYTPTVSESDVIGMSYTSYSYGEDIGYTYTDFTYQDDLIGDAGDSVCDILDEIVEYLGNYEYFYDLDGNFVFQEIKNYLNTSKTTVDLEKLSNNDYLLDMSNGKSVYTFDNSSLISSYSNTPQYNMIKNNFVIWGIRETASGSTIPIRYHLAIDEKPEVGNTYQCFFYTDPDDGLVKAKCPTVFTSKSYFPAIGTEGIFYMDSSSKQIYKWDSTNKKYTGITVGLTSVTTKDWRTELYLQGSSNEPRGTDSNYYYTELVSEWDKLYDVKNGCFYEEVKKYPTDIDYFLDFIDSGAAISELSVSNIGRRTVVVNDDNINCIFEPEIPNLVILNLGSDNIADLREECENEGQDYIQVDEDIFSMIGTGGTFKSAYDKARELLYQYTSYNESITIDCVPIYYLDANTRITVQDTKSGISGDYMINSININLDNSSQMSISCTRALERI